MLYKVHDTLSHIQFPYSAPPPAPAVPGTPGNINCINIYGGAPPPAVQAVAPPPYIPGPPVEPESNYVDPFAPSPAPAVADDDDEEYEFVPVRQRRNQFNKADYTPQDRKPIRASKPPPVFAPAPKPVAPVPVPKPMTPVAAPAPFMPAPFMPAEGEVVKPATPAWAGTLSSVGGPKLWDMGFKPQPINKPGRSVSPQKKASTPAASGDFKPTQTKVLDFTAGGVEDDGPRVMHLQYNSPLDMYSKANVEETLQGQTQAALGGGNTVAPNKTPAEERDWSQSALLRMIYEEESTNVPETAPLPPVEGSPRPAVSPQKVAASPVPVVSPEPPAEAVQEIPNSIPVAPPADLGYSDF